jgi:multiple sugar transport system substrate-binding protein
MDESIDPRSRPPLSRRELLKTGGKVAAGMAAAGALGGASDVPAALAGRIAAAPTTITVWFFNPWLRLAVQAFERKTPHIRVNFQLLGYDATHQKLLTSLAAGTGAPDLCGIDLGYIGVFTAKGGLVNLLQAPFHAGQYKKDFVAFKWTEGSTSDGRLIGMPWDIGPSGLWYRVDLFKAAGLETDPRTMQARIKTWDDLFALGGVLKKKTPKTKFLADPVNDIFFPMIEQQGHGFFKGNKVLIVEKATRPLEMAVKAKKRGLVADLAAGSAEWAVGFKKNAFAAMLAASWSQNDIQRDQPQTAGLWRAIHAPQGDYNQGGSFLAIPEQSTKKEAAWEFAKFVTATVEGVNIGFTQAGGVFPSYMPAWKSPVYHQPVAFFGGEKVNALWLDVARHIPGQVVSPYDRQAYDIVFNEATLALKEGKNPVQAMKDAQKQVLQRIPGTTS